MCSSSLPEAISRKPVNYTIKLPRLQMKCMPTLPLALEPAHRHRLSEWPEAGTASICPQKLAAVYLLSSRIGLWRRVLPHISHGRIDFSSVSLRGIDPRDYPVYRAAKGLYCGKLLITSAELADEEQVNLQMR